MASSETVLVTGGTGFIGSWISKAVLDAGHDVVAYDISTDTTVLEEVGIADDVEVRGGDITDEEDVRSNVRETGATRIIHLASLLTFKCRTSPGMAIDVNIRGTYNVLEAARQLDQVERVAWASTSGVYAEIDRYERDWVDESELLFPTTLYGATKEYGEHQARIYAEDHDVSTVALRLATVYGPYKEIGGDESKSSSAAISNVFVQPALGEPFSTDAGDHPLTWVYVKDVARAFRNAVFADEDDLSQLAYNITGEEIQTLSEVADVVGRYLPDAEFDISAERALAWNQQMDMSAAREDLDYEPEYDIEAGAEEYLNLIREYNGLNSVS